MSKQMPQKSNDKQICVSFCILFKSMHMVVYLPVPPLAPLPPPSCFIWHLNHLELLFFNCGSRSLRPALFLPEPLLCPPQMHRASLLFSSVWISIRLPDPARCTSEPREQKQGWVGVGLENLSDKNHDSKPEGRQRVGGGGLFGESSSFFFLSLLCLSRFTHCQKIRLCF